MQPAELEPFAQGCRLASKLVSSAPVSERWHEASSLHGLTVGGVVAHLYAGMRRFEVALEEEIAAPTKVVTLPEFYGRNRVDEPHDLDAGLHPLLREDAARRAAHGPEAVARRFDEVILRLHDRLPREPANRLIPVWTVTGGATRLESYVATRVVELIVHGDDLATSVDLPPLQLPTEAASVVIAAFTEMARFRSGDLGVIRAFARRERAAGDTLRVL